MKEFQKKLYHLKCSAIEISSKLNNFKKPILIVLLTLLTLIVFKDFIEIGFSNSDDTDNFTRALRGNLSEDSETWARGQGRFFFFFRNILSSIPYLFDNIIWLKCFQYIPIFLSLILFSYIFSKIYHSESFGYAIYTLLLIFLSVPSDGFALPIAYPFLFSFDILLFIISSLFLMKYFNSGRYIYYCFFLLFFTIPFFGYEAYFVFLVFFMIILFINGNANGELNRLANKKTIKEILPLLTVALSFYSIYFLYRANLDSHDFYDGSSFTTSFNFSHFFKFIFNVNKSAYPTYIYFNSFDVFKNYGQFQNTIAYIFSCLSYLTLLKSFLLSSIFTVLIYSIPVNNILYNKIIKYILLSLLLSYSINFILAISEKYQNYHQITSYCTTFFAFIGITFAIFLILLLSIKLLRQISFNKILTSFTIYLLLFFVSIVISFSNNTLSEDWKISQMRFSLINHVIDNKGLDDIPDNSIIYDSTLYVTNSNLGKALTGNTFSWKKYINTKSSHSFEYYQSFEQVLESTKTDSLKKSIYIFNKFEYPNDDMYFLVISKIERKHISKKKLIVKNLKVFSLGKREQLKNYGLLIDEILYPLHYQGNEPLNSRTVNKIEEIQYQELPNNFYRTIFFITKNSLLPFPYIVKK